jgi:hypothetical protein
VSTGVELRNRLVVATNVWRDHVKEPLPRMPKGDPLDQIEAFEIQLVEKLASDADPMNASEIAERTWDLVHDRQDGDPVKQRVVELHSELVKLHSPVE